MSVRTFSSKRPEPVAIDQVWEYGPNYHRTGRFWVRKQIRKDFWETIEVQNGAYRNYFVDDILNSAALTKVQPGQHWHDHDGALCRVVRPFSGRYDSWIVERNGTPMPYEIYEASILSWTLIEGLTGGSKSIGACPLCGCAGRLIFTSFECSSASCRNYRKQ